MEIEEYARTDKIKLSKGSRLRREPAPRRRLSRAGLAATCGCGCSHPRRGGRTPGGACSSTGRRRRGVCDDHGPHAVRLRLDDEAVEKGGVRESEEDFLVGFAARGARGAAPVANHEGVLDLGAGFRKAR
jgi:hypothetical protein